MEGKKRVRVGGDNRRILNLIQYSFPWNLTTCPTSPICPFASPPRPLTLTGRGALMLIRHKKQKWPARSEDQAPEETGGPDGVL